tara:strand:+ start:195 stop:638 length:444 start_codon:yes stop_codon:yes gene_type:complete
MKFLNNFEKNFSKLKTFEIVLAVLLVLYLVSGVSTPYDLAPYVNNIYIYLSLIAIVFLLFLHSNPILALFFAVTSIIFIIRSNRVSANIMTPSVENKNKKMVNLNNNLNKKTLEEEIIGQIVKNPMNINGPSSYHPKLCETYNAKQI